MTVRWKPLLVLSGLFLVTAVAGIAAIVYVLLPNNSASILPMARAEAKAGEFERAWLQYRRALQADGKNPAIHAEIAEMFGTWAEKETGEKRTEHFQQRLASLRDAAKYGPRDVAPRKALLVEALRAEETIEATGLAKDLIALVPDLADARFVLASEALGQNPPAIADAKQHLEVLQATEAERPRTRWIAARIALVERDEAAQEAIAESSRRVDPKSVNDPVDRLALLRVLAFDAQQTTDPAALAERVAPIQAVARTIADEADPAPARIAQLSDVVGQVRTALIAAAQQAEPAAKAVLDGHAASTDEIVEANFRKAVDGPSPDLRVFLSYAEYLLDRGQNERCYEVADRGLKLPSARLPVFRPVAMGLREQAIRAALAVTEDTERFAKATPLIKEMIVGGSGRDQGIGHLFQGAIDLERSGLTGGPEQGNTIDQVEAEKALASALDHLKQAAVDLPQFPTAQALYGITLILSREQALGRQYLQSARRLGPLEAKYQIWAAWSMIQAGYPEEAAPIVAEMTARVADGRLPRNVSNTLLMLEGEIARAQRSPEGLKKARADYQKALVDDPDKSAVQLKMAQIDLEQKDYDGVLKRLDAIRQSGKVTAGVEQLRVIALAAAERFDEARDATAKARESFPESGELAVLDAKLKVRDKQNEAADRVLVDFLQAHPDHPAATNLRASLLAGPLEKPEDARKLLTRFAEQSKTSDPWIQLAHFELNQNNYEAMARTIAQIRTRWKDAAAADLLDAQLILASRRDYRAASSHLDAALKKDPSNKVALFWKAQIDESIGSGKEAAKVYENLAQEKPVKELESGLSLTTAAEWALATRALENRDVDVAIARFDQLLKTSGDNTTLARASRWKLVMAHTAKGNWSTAREELRTLVTDPACTADEQVRAAGYFHSNKEPKVAVNLLDQVLKKEPGHEGAVVTRSALYVDDSKPDEAAALIRKAIATSKQSPDVYITFSAVEAAREPKDDANRRAMAALDQGLEAHPESLKLITGKYKRLQENDVPAALAFLEAKAKGVEDASVRRFLAEAYREQDEFAKAEQVVRDLLRNESKDRRDPSLTALLVRVLLSSAAAEHERGDVAKERDIDDKTAALIRQAREDFPDEVAFPRAEWELAMRRNELKRAIAITQEIDKLAPTTTIGPMLRAQVFASQDRIPEVAQAYAEAADRDPRRSDIKLLLAQTQLALGKADETLRIADSVLASEKGQRTAVLLKARALAAIEGTPSQMEARREQAVALLSAAIKEQPKNREAYQTLAEIFRQQGKRAEAIAILETDLKANPDDAAGLSLLIQLLTDARDKAKAPNAADEAKALKVADQIAGKDEVGQKALAVAIGFQRARRYELAIPWARKAAGLIDSPAVHLTCGDILLAQAESLADSASGRDLFREAIGEFDKVLKVQSSSVQAVNNKAWILHRYLNDNDAALELIEGMMQRVDPSTLPAEFFDTLGAIQETSGKAKDAEVSYQSGLRKSPDHPVLNYHMGRLIAGDSDRQAQAAPFLERARDGGERLPREMSDEVAMLLRRVGR